MSNILEKVKRAFRQIIGRFPSRLPVGMTEFDTWVDSIRSTYTLPTDNRDSAVFTFATMIMHLGPNSDSMSKYHFVRAFRAAAAKQIAGATFHELKERQKAEQAKQAAEVTVSGQNAPVASNGPKQ